jgi:hypothetical protein
LVLTVLAKAKSDTLKQLKCVKKGPLGVSYTKENLTTIKGCDSIFVVALDNILADTAYILLKLNNKNEFVFDGNTIKIKKDTVFYVDNIKTKEPCDFIKYYTLGATPTIDISAQIELTIAPNPFDDRTQIEILNSPFTTYQISIFDKLGRLVRTENIQHNRFEINRNGLSQGVYWLHITHGNIVVFDTKLAVF